LHEICRVFCGFIFSPARQCFVHFAGLRADQQQLQRYEKVHFGCFIGNFLNIGVPYSKNYTRMV
jgi:hypothetical protein